MFDLGGIRIEAISVAGLETCIELPDMGLAFDMGRCTPTAVRRPTVLFTHAHIDHLGGIITHCATRGLFHMPPPRYIVPRENEAHIRDLFATWRKLDGSDLACTIEGASPGDRLDLGKGLEARPFRCIHRVPCLGFGFWQKKNRLRADLVGQPPEVIVEARARGETVSEPVHSPIVAFTGDSRIEVVEREEVIRTAKLLVMEVSFLDEKVSVAACRDKGHIHLDEVIERAALFENEHILFTHLSARYSQEEAGRILDEKLPPVLKERVTLLPRSSPDHS